MIREAVETVARPGALPSREQTGVKMTEEAAAIVRAILELAIERDTLRDAIAPFTFQQSPATAFQDGDEGVTVARINDEDVQRARAGDLSDKDAGAKHISVNPLSENS